MDTSEKYDFSGDHRQSTINIKSTILQVANLPAADIEEFGFNGHVFLSSTFDDLRDYRKAVAEALNHYVQLHCPLMEVGTDGWVQVVDRCITIAESAPIYIGIFGHWYGWIPDGYDISITHIEFNAALEKKIKVNPPPILILEPSAGSDAWKDLKQRAESHVKSSNYSESHDTLLSEFRKQYKNSGRIVQFFTNKEDLVLRAAIFCMRMRQAQNSSTKSSLLNLAQQHSSQTSTKTEKPKKNTVSYLGNIGRRAQIEFFRNVFQKLNLPEHNHIPSIALMVSGKAQMGHREFVQYILSQDEFKNTRPVTSIKSRPPILNYGLQTLIQWTGEMLGKDNHDSTDDLDTLAIWIHKSLKEQNLAVVLDHIELFDLQKFYNLFWKPLSQKLTLLRKMDSITNRLIFILTDYKNINIVSNLNDYSSTNTDDLTKILMVPELGELTREDITDWLRGEGIHQSKISPYVRLGVNNQTDDISLDDCIPDEVYERLRGELPQILKEKNK